MKFLNRWVIFWLIALAFLAPIKFGTPVSVQMAVPLPLGFFDWFFFSWPNQLAALLVCGGLIWMVLDPERIAARVDWLFYLPIAFLITQLFAVPTSICPQSSADTLMHFAVCVLLFYAAAWYVRDGAVANQIFTGFGIATFLVLIYGIQQHYGGLAETREYAQIYGDKISRGLHYKLMSERVFATLGSPNTLAAYLVLMFAPTMAWIWVRARSWNVRVKWLTLVYVGGLMIFCLALTGSRGGFVAFAAMTVAGLICIIPGGQGRALWLIGALAAIVVIALIAQQAGFLHFGTSSISSRGDYWRGAVAIAKDHPLLGTGPGTFGSIYPKYKTASSEEARLVHNDFLEMWSDSGILAFLVFAALWIVALRDAFALARQRRGDAASLAICAALTGWAVHGLIDFDLYVPGVAIPAFLLLGMLQGLKGLPDVKIVPSTGKSRRILAGVCLAILLFILWTEGRSFIAWRYQGQATMLADTKHYEAALAKTQSAIALDPNNPGYYLLAGDFTVILGRFNEAVDYYQSAILYDPYRASYHWRLARGLMAAGAAPAGIIEELTAATRLNPTQSLYQEDLRGFKESIRQPTPPLLESLPAETHSLN